MPDSKSVVFRSSEFYRLLHQMIDEGNAIACRKIDEDIIAILEEKE